MALKRHTEAMDNAISRVREALETMGKEPAWSDDIKASDEFLAPVLRTYYEILELPNVMEKSNFHKLVEFIPDDELDSEVAEKLNAISDVALSV